MTTRTSINDLLQSATVTLHANEAVAIVQQLIHSHPSERDVAIEQPFGPPSPQNVYLDDNGLVTCRACQATPAVAEIAILLQQLLPPGTPKVPGALRYALARALHEVDAPPFDSIQEFSAALKRFETGSRTVVVRGLFARATAVSLDRLRARSGDDRRRLMPSSTDFRRELRAADARYYELASATGHIVLAPPKAQAELRRSPTLVAGVLTGVCLVFVGEVMNTRSGTARVTPPDSVRSAAVDLAPDPLPVRRTVPFAPAVKAIPAVVQVDSSPRPVVKRVSRPTAQQPPASRARHVKSKPGIMDRLRLGWLRNAFTVRHDPL